MINLLVVFTLVVLATTGNAAKLQSYQLPSHGGGGASRDSFAQTNIGEGGGQSPGDFSLGGSTFESGNTGTYFDSSDGLDQHSTDESRPSFGSFIGNPLRSDVHSGASSGHEFDHSSTLDGLGSDGVSDTIIEVGNVRGGSSNTFQSGGHSTGLGSDVSFDGGSQGTEFGIGTPSGFGVSRDAGFSGGVSSDSGISQGGSFNSGGITQGGNSGSGLSSGSRGFGSHTFDGCGVGEARRADGLCVRAKITRNIFSFESPKVPRVRTEPVLPDPEIHYNVVVVRTPEVDGSTKPIVVPPPKQKTLVLVLTKRQGVDETGIVEFPSSLVEPEVFFVDFEEGDNPDLPGGINLQEALQRAKQKGQLIDPRRGGGNSGFDFSSGGGVTNTIRGGSQLGSGSGFINPRGEDFTGGVISNSDFTTGSGGHSGAFTSVGGSSSHGSGGHSGDFTSVGGSSSHGSGGHSGDFTSVGGSSSHGSGGHSGDFTSVGGSSGHGSGGHSGDFTNVGGSSGHGNHDGTVVGSGRDEGSHSGNVFPQIDLRIGRGRSINENSDSTRSDGLTGASDGKISAGDNTATLTSDGASN